MEGDCRELELLDTLNGALLLRQHIWVSDWPDGQVAVQLDGLVVLQRRRVWNAERQWSRTPLNFDEILLTLVLTELELELNSVHWCLLLVVISEEDLEQAFDLAVRSLRRLVLSHEANLHIYILIDNAFVTLKQRVYVETLELLL